MGELKIYEVKEEDWDNVNARRCANCGHYTVSPDLEHHYCDIDKHGIAYLDWDMYWCRRWKRDRKWDGVEENPMEEGKWAATSNESE